MRNPWKNRIPAALAFLVLLTYFLLFAVKSVGAHFAPDDMMNIEGYWKRGIWLILADNLRFWSSAYRPMGGLYYLPLYRMFGLNPLPYHVVALAFVFAGSWLSYLVVELLTKSRAVALVAGIICCAHATMMDVYYAPAVIYDILARFFSMMVLLMYIRIRDRGDIPSLRQALLIILLFAAALDSKEISVIIAGSVLSYEVIFHGMPRHWVWLTREGLVPALLMVTAIAYTIGKLFGPHSLAETDHYRIVASGNRYLENNVIYTGKFFYGFFFKSTASLLVADLALFLLLFHKNPVLRWAAFYALTATLPISFIATRGGASLLVPLLGWAVLLPALLVSAWSPSWKYSKWALNITLTLFCLFFVQRTLRYWKPQAFLLDRQQKTWRVLTQLEDLHFRPKGRSKVIIVNDPWVEEWDMIFISELAWDDPTIDITLSRKLPSPPGPKELARFDSVLEFGEDGNLRVVR